MKEYNSAIVKIIDKNNNSIGTGFFSSPKGFIITCFHVLDRSGYKLKDRIRFQKNNNTEIETGIWIKSDKTNDFAILTTRKDTEYFLSLLDYTCNNLQLEVMGYPHGLKSILTTMVSLNSVTENGLTLQLGNANAITLGFSGAPIIYNDCVVGIIREITNIDSYGRMSEIAFGLSSKAIINQYPHFVFTNYICSGYGDKKGKCNNIATENELCLDCFIKQYNDEVKALFRAQQYTIHEYDCFFIAELKYSGIISYYDLIVPIIKNEKINQNDYYKIMSYKDRCKRYNISNTRIVTNAKVSSDWKEIEGSKDITIQSKENILHYLFDLDSYHNDLATHVNSVQLSNHYIDVFCKHSFNETIQLVDESYDIDYDNTDKECKYLKNYVDDFLASSYNSLLVLGEYGSGKTSFCYKYTLYRLDLFRKERSSYFPILIKLRGYNKSIGIDELLTDYFINHLGITNFNIKSFKMLLKNINILLVLDGFDEIAKKVDFDIKYEVLQSISNLVEDKTKVVLTCRPNYFQNANEFQRLFNDSHISFEPGEKPLLQFIETSIAELTPDQIRGYINSYQKELNSENISVTDMIDAIAGTHDLTDLSKRPFLLFLILSTLPKILKEAKTEGLKKINASKLYMQYTDSWILREEGKNKTLLKSEDKKLFCKELAYELCITGSSSLSYRKFPETIKKYFSNVIQNDEIDYFSHDIQSCTFLTSDRSGDFRFIHQSFMEFFVADRVVSKLSKVFKDDEDYQVIDKILGKTLFSREICFFICDYLTSKHPSVTDIESVFNYACKNGFQRETIANLLSILSKASKNIGEILDKCGLRDFSEVDYGYSRFYDNTIVSCSFEKSHFYESDFMKMKFINCNFINTVFENTKLENVLFINCTFKNSIWKHSKMKDVCFGEGYDTFGENTYFENTTWAKVQINSCTFYNSIFTDNIFSRVTIIKSKFFETDFSNSHIDEFTKGYNNEYDDCIGLPYEFE